MTLREAYEAAQKGLPIIHTQPGQPPIEYIRITRAGHWYNGKHERGSFVQLLSKSGSVTYADPAHCALKEDNG